MGDCTISAVCRLNLSRKTDVINIRLCFWTNYPSQSGETESSSCQVFLLSYIIELFSRRRFLQFLLDEIILPEKLKLYPALIYMQTSPFYCANRHMAFWPADLFSFPATIIVYNSPFQASTLSFCVYPRGMAKAPNVS